MPRDHITISTYPKWLVDGYKEKAAHEAMRPERLMDLVLRHAYKRPDVYDRRLSAEVVAKNIEEVKSDSSASERRPKLFIPSLPEVKKSLKNAAKDAGRDLREHVLLILMNFLDSGMTVRGLRMTQNAASAVKECLSRQWGAGELDVKVTLEAIKANGAVLAGCLNSNFGLAGDHAFTEQMFPPTMTIEDCIMIVRKR
jgi:hypothetical protein